MIHKSGNNFAVGKPSKFIHKLADCPELLPAMREKTAEETIFFYGFNATGTDGVSRHTSDRPLHLSLFLSEIDRLCPSRILLNL